MSGISLLSALRTLAEDPRTKNNVITLEGLHRYTERLIREFAAIEDIEPNIVEGATVNGDLVAIDPDTKFLQLEVPTRVSQLDDAGSYLHIKALRRILTTYIQWGDLPTTVLAQEEKDRLDKLPDLDGDVGPNGVRRNEEGWLELQSVTPDRIVTDGFAFILDCGDTDDQMTEVEVGPDGEIPGRIRRIRLAGEKSGETPVPPKDMWLEVLD